MSIQPVCAHERSDIGELTDITDISARLARYCLDDPGSALPFSRRLARDNRWSEAYTARVLDEYKRFMVIAVCAGHPVTPSDEVDQAWHLHLTYTECYWLEFCPQVLGRALHHGPTRGGRQELHKHGDWYAQTLASYRRLFAQEPPADIWPVAQRRFANTAFRCDTRTHWVIPRVQQWPKLFWNAVSTRSGRLRLRHAATMVPVTLVAALSTGCDGAGLLLFSVVGAIVVALFAASNSSDSKGTDRGGGGGCGGGGCGGGCGSGCGGCGGCGGA